MRYIIGGWRLFRKYTFIPVNVTITKVCFLLREFFLGFENANNYLKRVSQSSIIPILRMKGAKIGDRCNIQSGIVFHNCQNYSKLIVGNNCHIGKCCFFDMRETITIGDNVVIGMKNTFITHIDMSNSILRNRFPATQKPLIVEDDVYIGANCNIIMGVTIQEKAFIAANSLINKNVKKLMMVGGVPGKEIKKIDGI